MPVVAWQGWRLDLPQRWNPVKLEGDYNKGYMLFADLHRPRLGVRWDKPPGKKFDPAKWAKQALVQEIGQLAADEARPFEMPADWSGSMLYLEPQPPGRDVWVGYSKISGRAIQVVYHARRRERMLAESVLPGLSDQSNRQRRPWAIFELSCIVPADLPLATHQLNAGDLSLTFTNRRRTVTVQQIAVAELALKRLSLEQWLTQQHRPRKKTYRASRNAAEIELTTADGRILRGISKTLTRRRRFFLSRKLLPLLETCALHDIQRDRLILLEASNELLLRETAQTVGWERA